MQNRITAILSDYDGTLCPTNSIRNQDGTIPKELRPRKYSDILVGQFEIGKIIRVNRKNDEHTISDKIFDFSHKTIQQLKESGYNNTTDLSDVEFS